MILIANSGVLENVIFRQTVGSQSYRSFASTWTERVVLLPETGVILALYGEVGGHVIIDSIVNNGEKACSVRSFIIIFLFLFFLLNIFDMVIWALQLQETENTLHQQANGATKVTFCLLRRKINKHSQRRKTKLSAIKRTLKLRG